MPLEKLNLPTEQLLQIQIRISLYIFYSKVILLFQNPFYPLNTSSELHDDPFVIKRLSSKEGNAVKIIQIQLQTEEVMIKRNLISKNFNLDRKILGKIKKR